MELFGLWWPTLGVGFLLGFSGFGFGIFLILLAAAIWPGLFISDEEWEEIRRKQEDDRNLP